MAASLSFLSSLSFSSNISRKPTTLSLSRIFSLYRSSKLPSLTVSATSLAPPVESKVADLKTGILDLFVNICKAELISWCKDPNCFLWHIGFRAGEGTIVFLMYILFLGNEPINVPNSIILSIVAVAEVKWVIRADKDRKTKFCCVQPNVVEQYL
ncbi:unnamed protein product [Vicia faba]|uniref:Uncharacterized protein n=1 Tax=Vicia faba TaxID=3906 RepID=A0AAV0ZFQ3_VICFA|nr:unnamed protein product [Vicia faba]